MVVVRAGVAKVPELGFGPLQPPEAMQLCAFCTSQEIVTESPRVAEAALGFIDTWGLAAVALSALLGSRTLPPQAASARSAEQARTNRLCGAEKFLIAFCLPCRVRMRTASHPKIAYDRASRHIVIEQARVDKLSPCRDVAISGQNFLVNYWTEYTAVQ